MFVREGEGKIDRERERQREKERVYGTVEYFNNCLEDSKDVKSEAS